MFQIQNINMEKAVKNNNLTMWPGLTNTVILHRLLKSTETLKGYMDHNKKI